MYMIHVLCITKDCHIHNIFFKQNIACPWHYYFIDIKMCFVFRCMKQIRSTATLFNNNYNNDHGFLSGLGAQKLDTLFRHYYPEEGWAWVIVCVAVLIAILNHGFQLSSIFFLLPAGKRFGVTEVDCLGEYKL